jgi:hypothetical protein
MGTVCVGKKRDGTLLAIFFAKRNEYKLKKLKTKGNMLPWLGFEGGQTSKAPHLHK